MSEKLKIGALISGNGTNAQAITTACLEGRVNAEVVFIGADNPDAKGLYWARCQNIPTFVVDYRTFRENQKRVCSGDDYPSNALVQAVFEKSAYVHELFDGDKAKQLKHIRARVAAEMALFREIKKRKIDLLVLAGFMQFCTSFLIDSMNIGDDDPRIMNIHPALLPAFPGTDGYGDTIRYGCKVGGCTVHFVDYGEDSGPIIGQRAIPVLPEDDVDSFRKKGLEQEYLLYPECIQLFAEERLMVVDNGGRKNVFIIPSGLKITKAEETHNYPLTYLARERS